MLPPSNTMTRRNFQSLLCSLLALAASHCPATTLAMEPPGQLPGQLRTKKELPSVDDLTAATNALALRLLNTLDGKSGENQFLSPLSIQLALCIALEGARGETARQMGSALQFPDSLVSSNGDAPWKLDDLRTQIEAFSGWVASAESAEEYELRIANGLWVDSTYPLSAEYAERIEQHYGNARSERVDFEGAADVERQKINAWVSQQTKDRIEQILAPGTIDRLTRLVIANAIYFKGEWQEPFTAEQTQPQDFTLASGANSTVSMMNSSRFETGRYAAFRADGALFQTPRMMAGDFNERDAYPPEDGFQALELDYSGDNISMVILLPRSTDGLPALIESLTIERLQAVTEKLAKRPVQLSLPKFKIQSTYQLVEPLQRLGMSLAFSDQADFGGMSDSSLLEDRLKIALVVHKAFVEVSEEGTEAAAATAVVMSRTSAVALPPFVPSFKADHPFLFVIRERHSGLILFIGRVEQPAES